MGFLNALGQIRSNKKNFKKWEQENADKNAQREALAKKNIVSKEDIKKSASQGKVIMDVVDIMDTHSEEVSENIEQAIMPVAQLTPMLSTELLMLLLGKFKLAPVMNKYSKAVNAFLDKEDYRALAETLEKKGIKGATWNTTNVFSKKGLKKIAELGDNSLLSEAKRLKGEYEGIKEIKALPKAFKLAGAALVGTFGLLYVASNVIAAKVQVKSSRIARWQSRQDLSDPKYFVQYNDEQIKQAQQNLDNKPKEKSFFFKKKNKFDKRNSLIKTITGTVKDNKKYNEWKSQYNLEDKKVKKELSKEELIKAQRDKEVIQRITKQINNKAEEYSENMEVAAGVIIGGTPVLGAAVGALINLINDKTGLADKISQKNFETLLKTVAEDEREDLRTAFKNLKPKKEGGKIIKPTLTKQAVFYHKLQTAMFSNLSKDEMKNLKLTQKLSAMKNLAFSTPFARKSFVTVAGAMITGIAGALIGLKLQKSSARAGRYIAKREIEQNEMNFVGYTQEEFDSVKDTKAQKQPLSKKFVNYITFIPRVLRDYFNYSKYKKTQAKHDKELLEELVKLDVSKQQLNEAKDLQRKVFSTFENVDDKSQEYSESMEAVNEMLQPFIPYIGVGVASIPFIIGGIKLAKGGPVNITKKVSGFLAKHSGFLRSKAVTKYLNDVSANIPNVVQKESYITLDKNTIRYLKELAGQLGEAEKSSSSLKTVNEIVQKAVEEVASENKGKGQLSQLLNKLADDKTLKGLNVPENIVSRLFNQTENIPENISFAQLFEMLGTKVEALKGPSAHYKDLPYCTLLSNIMPKSDTAAQKTTAKASNKAFKKALDELSPALDFGVGLGRKILQKYASSGELGNDELSAVILKLANSNVKNKEVVEIIKHFAVIANNIPAKQLGNIYSTALKEFSKNPEKFAQSLMDGSFKKVLITKGIIKAGAITTGVWASLSIALSFALESVFASMQKKAGRLGVMKALEEMQDNKYYANEYSTSFSANIKKDKNIAKVENTVSNPVAKPASNAALSGVKMPSFEEFSKKTTN